MLQSWGTEVLVFCHRSCTPDTARRNHFHPAASRHHPACSWNTSSRCSAARRKQTRRCMFSHTRPRFGISLHLHTMVTEPSVGLPCRQQSTTTQAVCSRASRTALIGLIERNRTKHAFAPTKQEQGICENKLDKSLHVVLFMHTGRWFERLSLSRWAGHVRYESKSQLGNHGLFTTCSQGANSLLCSVCVS